MYYFSHTVICSSGSSKIKGTASGIYPIHCGFQGNTYIPQEVVLLPGGLYIAQEVTLTSWGIYISSRKSADFKKLPPTYPSVRKEERLASQRVKPKLPLKRLRRFYSTKVSWHLWDSNSAKKWRLELVDNKINQQ